MNLLRIKHVAKLLDITERTIWNKIKSGELPSIKVAGITRIDGDKLRALIEEQSAYRMDELASSPNTERIDSAL